MNKKNLKYISILGIFLLLFSSCTMDQGNLEEDLLGDCQELLEEFDYAVNNDMCFSDFSVAASLSKIDEEFYEYPPERPYGPESEYIYTLTFQGVNEESVFRVYNPTSVDLGLEEGKIYQFNYQQACGPITSMGPYNGMIPYSDLEIFQELTCE